MTKQNKNTLYTSLLFDAPKLIFKVSIICIFLAIVYADIAFSFAATILCLMWVRSEQSADLATDFNSFRLYKALFVKIGTWLKQEDASKDYDQILSDTHMIDVDIEDEYWKQIVMGESIYKYSQGIIVFGLEIYLFVITFRGVMYLI